MDSGKFSYPLHPSFCLLHGRQSPFSDAYIDIGRRCRPTSTLVPGQTTPALYEVYRQTIWWDAFKIHSIEYVHSYINCTIIPGIRVIQQFTDIVLFMGELALTWALRTVIFVSTFYQLFAQLWYCHQQGLECCADSLDYQFSLDHPIDQSQAFCHGCTDENPDMKCILKETAKSASMVSSSLFRTMSNMKKIRIASLLALS